MKGLSVQWPTEFRWPLLRATRPREGGGRASSAQSPGAGIPRGRGQGGYGAGPTVSHLLKKGARGVGVEKEKEIKRVIPHISNRRPRPRRGAQIDTRLGWHKAVGSPQRPAWTRGLPPALGIGSQGARANAGRGAAQSETATIRVRQHSFESFFPGVWSQPRGTGPGREPKRGRGGKGFRTAYSEETSQVSRL